MTDTNSRKMVNENLLSYQSKRPIAMTITSRTTFLKKLRINQGSSKFGRLEVNIGYILVR